MRTFFTAFVFMLLPLHAAFGASENVGAAPDSSSSAYAVMSRSVPVHKYRYARENGRARVIYRGELRTSVSLMAVPPTVGLGLDIVNGISTGRWDVGLGFGLEATTGGWVTGKVYATVKADVYEGSRSTLFVGGDVGGCLVVPLLGGEYLRTFFGTTLNARRNLSLCGGVSLCGPIVGLDATLSYKF